MRARTCVFDCSGDPRDLHSFPTRRSSDLSVRSSSRSSTCRKAGLAAGAVSAATVQPAARSEEHTSELQSRPHLVCRLLLEKKNNGVNPGRELLGLFEPVEVTKHADEALLD